MKQFMLGLSLSFAFVLGCVTAAAVTSRAQASRAPGAPQPAGDTECFATTTWIATGKAVNEGTIPNTMRVPAGWTAVSGGGLSHDGISALVILCRNAQ